MEISGKTRVCGIIGDPIEHTLSPAMHNAAFDHLGLDYVYLPFHVRREGLTGAVEGLRALNIRGINVTIPHKVAVRPLLDRLDSLAERLGAVNTVVNDDGTLTGYNTDAEGFLRALQDKGIEPGGKKAVLVGAGGAGRAVAFALVEAGASLIVLNRGEEAARELARAVSRYGSASGGLALGLGRENLAQALSDADILVNATSLGMSPHTEETPVEASLLRPGLVVFDIVYRPVKTRLLREAEEAGAKTIGGLDMLVGQGALAFERWTGKPAPVEVMKEAVKGVLS